MVIVVLLTSLALHRIPIIHKKKKKKKKKLHTSIFHSWDPNLEFK